MGEAVRYRKDNTLIECACGCGQKRLLYDRKGRMRRYVFGHARRRFGNLYVLQQLVEHCGSSRAAARLLGISHSSIRTILRRNRLSYKVDLENLGTSTALGRKGELDALKLLSASVDATKNRADESPFDLLWQGQRIDVKASTINNSGKNLRWSFKTWKASKCDFFLCLGYVQHNERAYAWLVPSTIAPQSTVIPAKSVSKWDDYLFWAKPGHCRGPVSFGVQQVEVR